MPSVSNKSVQQQPQEKVSVDCYEPLKQALTLIEHKVRNMEKRKSKLDSYRQEQASGKELNADQLLAVSKYGEVVQTIEFAKELSKAFNQIQLEATRALKKQKKREQSERTVNELLKAKQTIVLLNTLNNFIHGGLYKNFLPGSGGQYSVSNEELRALEYSAGIISFTKTFESDEDMESAAQFLSNLVEGSSKSIEDIESDITYEHLKTLLLTISKNTQNVHFDGNGVNVEMEVVSMDGDNPVPRDADVSPQSEEGYIKEEEDDERLEDIESPHFDPAVVAVSSHSPRFFVAQQVAAIQQALPKGVVHSGVNPETNSMESETPQNHWSNSNNSEDAGTHLYENGQIFSKDDEGNKSGSGDGGDEMKNVKNGGEEGRGGRGRPRRRRNYNSNRGGGGYRSSSESQEKTNGSNRWNGPPQDTNGDNSDSSSHFNGKQFRENGERGGRGRGGGGRGRGFYRGNYGYGRNENSSSGSTPRNGYSRGGGGGSSSRPPRQNYSNDQPLHN